MCSGFETPVAERLATIVGRIPEFNYTGECFPGRDAPIVIRDLDGTLVPVRASFGMLPHWAKPVLARQTYNARSETVADKPSFRNAWGKLQTCLIPVEGFYEPSYESGKPIRHVIRRKNGELIFLAGLWETRKEDDGRDHRTFTMLTINAEHHPLMRRFHAPEDEKRSVVPVDVDDWLIWLAPESHDELRALLKPFDADQFFATPKPIPPRAKKA